MLDFMSAHCSSSFSSSSSSSSPCLVVTNCDDVCSVRSVLPSTESVRSISVPRRTSTVILWDQCSAPDLNCDIVGSVFRAERRAPQGACGQDTGHIRTNTAWIDRSPCISTTLISVKFTTILFRQGLNSTKVVDMGCGQK